ncbi:LADA_0H12926g1_1 [Lachancea dasiensis]|uniref:LADA_0H12926g1_1 n=1 Tax=Lachancea dasiensis TaxID=1072105 RepID=A0A1G4K417_9SACH|nr:LADA_0H12926g1_1 [Lachancea dasiensis]
MRPNSQPEESHQRSQKVRLAARMNNQSQVLETFVKKIFTFLDEKDSQQLAPFLQCFDAANSKVIVNANPFAQAALFLETWQRGVVQTQHVLTGMDYHVIPGTGSTVCSVNGKVRFDESGKDKAGQDSVIPDPSAGNPVPISGSLNSSTPAAKHRPLWGPYFGTSLQLVLDDRVLNGDQNCVISSFNYTMVYKPDDSLMAL